MAGHHAPSASREETALKEFDLNLFRQLLRLLKPYWPWVALAISLLLAGSFFSNYTPKVVQRAIDGPIAHHDLSGLWAPVLLFLLLKSGSFLFTFLQVFTTAFVSTRVIRDLRLKLFAHIQSLSMRYFSKNPVGRLMSRVVSDTDVLNELFSSGLITVFGDIFSLAFIVFFMFSLHVKLTLVCLAILPPVLLVSSLFKRNVREQFRKIRLKTADINTHLQESITGMSVIQLFNQEKRDGERFNVHNKEYCGYFLKTIFYFSLFYPAMELLSSIGLCLVLWYGGLRYLDSGLTVGILVAFVEYMRTLFNPIRDLAEKYNVLQNAMASSERVFQVLAEKPEIQLPSYPVTPQDESGRIEFSHVSFGYVPGKEVLSDVSFIVKPGETVAVVGATGAGKSTLIHLLNRFYDPLSGHIKVDGVPLTQLSSAELRKRIGTVSQDLFIFSDTVAENIRLGEQRIQQEAMEEISGYINADRFIRQQAAGYEEVLKERGTNLSTGQKQLLAFARVLAFSPAILVLDEATSSVDPQTEKLIQEAIAKLTRGRTCLIVAHRLSTIRHAHRILVMHHGRITESGTHDTLLQQDGIYSRLYQLQFSGN
ncbi:MAG: hypothetical protein A2293_09085 [Elusimicrobia bacterium RIFOXYB2_FULL_49_7]|nr:MAG: hypothetical protein A2293_09085 [Elusimicrobia bacterium RIFOXYB2_FULL_49_7]